MQAEVVYWTLGFCKTANSGLGHYREFRERRVIGVCGRGVRSVNCIHLLMIVKPRSRRPHHAARQRGAKRRCEKMTETRSMS